MRALRSTACSKSRPLRLCYRKRWQPSGATILSLQDHLADRPFVKYGSTENKEEVLYDLKSVGDAKPGSNSLPDPALDHLCNCGVLFLCRVPYPRIAASTPNTHAN